MNIACLKSKARNFSGSSTQYVLLCDALKAIAEQEQRVVELARKLAQARIALEGAKVLAEAYFDKLRRDPSNNDNYCRVVDALSQIDSVAPPNIPAGDSFGCMGDGHEPDLIENAEHNRRVFNEAQTRLKADKAAPPAKEQL